MASDEVGVKVLLDQYAGALWGHRNMVRKSLKESDNLCVLQRITKIPS